ncbi:hypothetical protein YC2023_040388 [Brassica napus]
MMMIEICSGFHKYIPHHHTAESEFCDETLGAMFIATSFPSGPVLNSLIPPVTGKPIPWYCGGPGGGASV